MIIKAASSVERVFDAPQAVVRTSRCVCRCLEDSAVGKREKFQADRTTYIHTYELQQYHKHCV